MPELAQYPAQPQDLIELSNDERRKHAEHVKAAWAYYDGEMRKPLKVAEGEPDQNVIINLIGKMIDQAVELLFGDEPEYQLDESAEENPAEQALEDVWKANRGSIFLNNLGTSGALAGHCYVKVIPTEDPARPVRFVALKPEQVTVFWQPDDLERVTAYMIYWSRGDNEYREDHVNLGSSWQIMSMAQTGGKGWAVTNTASWPYPWSQVHDWQNLPDPRNYYGQADLQNPMLNDSLNAVLSDMKKIQFYFAAPRTIGTGFTAKQLEKTNIGSFWTIPNEKATIRNLEMTSDLSSSMTFAQQLQAQFWSEHRGFDMTSIKDRLGQLTNFGLRVLMGDALNKAGTKRELYGVGLQAINRHALELLGYGPDNVTEIVWPDMLPANTLEVVQVEQLKLGMGITSKQSAAVALGLDWEDEQERIADETTGQDDIGARLLRAFEQGQ